PFVLRRRLRVDAWVGPLLRGTSRVQTRLGQPARGVDPAFLRCVRAQFGGRFDVSDSGTRPEIPQDARDLFVAAADSTARAGHRSADGDGFRPAHRGAGDWSGPT